MTILEAQGISFAYGRDTVILNSWSSNFDAGEVVAITGESGRGKSTLLYILGLLVRANSGQLLIDGIDASDLTDRQRSRLRATAFGFVFQDAALDLTRSVLDNVMEGALYRGEPRAAARSRARELMAQFGVLIRAENRPGQVSGGQAQRIALCRALMNDPQILLADEPTGNLDRASATVVMEALKGHARSGKLVIVVTHDPFVIDQCDREIDL